MPLLDSYRKHSFLQSESGSHLERWRGPSHWMSQQASGGFKALQSWSHYVLEPPEQALDYLDWLNRRHPSKPYLLRRLLLPAWLLTRILEGVGTQQLARIQRVDQAQRYEIAAYVYRAQLWQLQIRTCLQQRAWLVPLIRAIRLNSEWLRERERLIRASIEATESDSAPEPVEVRATPWDRLGVGSWKAKKVLQDLLALQEMADDELLLSLADFESRQSGLSPQQAKRTLLLRSPNGNPRRRRGHYVFRTAEQSIDYLIWLNHRHPERPYFLRRLLLPTDTLTRMIEAIGTHQIARVQTIAPGMRVPVARYADGAKARAREIQSCSERNALAIPMMRAVRLNGEWLRERQGLIQACLTPSEDGDAEPIEVRVRPWTRGKGGTQPVNETLRALLDLQLGADEELFHSLSKAEQ